MSIGDKNIRTEFKCMLYLTSRGTILAILALFSLFTLIRKEWVVINMKNLGRVA